MAKIRAQVNGKHLEQSLEVFINKFEKGFMRAKEESLREFFKRVKKEAVRNIERHKTETGYPGDGTYANDPGKLGRSIGYNVSKGLIWVGDGDTPYAVAHNQDEGTTTPIVANGNKYLVFYNHRTGRWNKKRYVMRPGIGFFTRAWTSQLDDLSEIFGENVRHEIA